jgi:transposase
MKASGRIKDNAAIFGLPYETAWKFWKKYRDTGTVAHRPRSGRPPTVTPHLEQQIVRKAQANRRKPFTDVSNEVEPPVSRYTIAKVLDSHGLHRQVARKVPYLTRAQRKVRAAWARDRKKMADDEWEKVMWSDECYVILGEKKGRVYVTCTVDEVYDEDCLVPTFKQSSVHIMVWGCIAHNWKGPLVVLEYPSGKGGGMTAQRYQEQVLDGVLAEVMEKMKKERPGIQFQQDGAASHKAKLTHQWFAAHHIPLFPQPPNSPDLSPIAPLWNELKGCICAH